MIVVKVKVNPGVAPADLGKEEGDMTVTAMMTVVVKVTVANPVRVTMPAAMMTTGAAIAMIHDAVSATRETAHGSVMAIVGGARTRDDVGDSLVTMRTVAAASGGALGAEAHEVGTAQVAATGTVTGGGMETVSANRGRCSTG